MSKFADVSIGDLFEARSGKPVYTRDYVDAHPGPFPVYSAAMTRPFGFINSADFDGHYLTWVMNGYGGRVQEVSGQFSANRDRGVFVPRRSVRTPDLSFLRIVMERELTAAAVGRRVDGRLNEYTKIYPDTALAVSIRIPIDSRGGFDYQSMERLGNKLRRVEDARATVRAARDRILQAEVPIRLDNPYRTLSLSDTKYFSLSIGTRILKSEQSSTGVPVFSANALKPFGFVTQSNLEDFSKPSLLWGIDGNFDWNLIPSNHEFATTDHCGRLQLLDQSLDPEYVFWYLRLTKDSNGFDRVYRASLENVRADVTVNVPCDSSGKQFSLARQREVAMSVGARETSREKALAALKEVLRAQLSLM